METTQRSRSETALENQAAAQLACQQGWYRVSVSRSYYACFQAMWGAVGDPPLGQWKHGGLMKTFCLGRWAEPILLPTSLASLYKKLLAVYDLRLDADYRALPVPQDKAEEGLETMTTVFQVTSQHNPSERGAP